MRRILIITGVVGTLPLSLAISCQRPQDQGDAGLTAAEEGPKWHIETLDVGMGTAWHPPPIETSIAVDVKGHPHITYRDCKNGCLKYAYYDGEDWVTNIIDAGGNAGRGNSITLGLEKEPIVAYIAKEGFKVARRDKGRWNIQVIDPEGWASGDHSIISDPAGVIHIAYFIWSVRTPSKLKYARNPTGNWELETLSGKEPLHPKRRKNTSIALDSNGLPFISLPSPSPSGNLKIYRRSANKWVSDSLGGDKHIGLYTSIAIDNRDKVHISYFSDGTLTYAYFDGNTWVEETVDNKIVQSVGPGNSLAVDAGGVPHIAYLGSDADLKYAKRLAGGWHIETVDSKGSVGWCCSIALDSNGRPHISYHDRSNDAVKYARLFEP